MRQEDIILLVAVWYFVFRKPTVSGPHNPHVGATVTRDHRGGGGGSAPGGITTPGVMPIAPPPPANMAPGPGRSDVYPGDDDDDDDGPDYAG